MQGWKEEEEEEEEEEQQQQQQQQQQKQQQLYLRLEEGVYAGVGAFFAARQTPPHRGIR
jgi:hypothetical protein